MELIRLENITKTYHLGEVDVPVLKGISLTINRGELVALMGLSGSGKTTLMNLLGCLDRPSSGQYWLDGKEISTLSSDELAMVRNQKIGFVFQSFNLLPRTSALDQVTMPLQYTLEDLTDAAGSGRARGLLKRVGLSDRMDHEPTQMSGGQQQRVAIARSLVNRPPLLLADEPTGNLDSRTSEEILAMFQRLNDEGITIILVTHAQEVAQHAKRVIRIKDGLIEDDGSGRGRHGPSNGDGRRAEALITAVAAGSVATLPERAVATAAHAEHGENGNGQAVAVAPPPAVVVDKEAIVVTRQWTHIFPRTLRTAVHALRRNILCSALTTLGIIIGVAAVIAMMEIGQGTKQDIQKKIASMGADNLLVMPGAAASGGVTFGGGSGLTLTPDDAFEIAKQCPSVSDVAPIVRVRVQAVFGNKNWVPFYIYGTTPDFLRVRDWTELEEGEDFTEQDVRNQNRVCLVGQTIVRELFGGQSPVGRDVRLQNVAFKVVGVLKSKGANMMGMDQDDIILAPWTTIKYRVSGNSASTANQSSANAVDTSQQVNSLSKLYPGTSQLYPIPSASQAADTPLPVRFTNIDQILAKVPDPDGMQQAMREITGLLRERHRLKTGQADDFQIRDMTEMTKVMSSTSTLMGSLLLCVALISLVVGGVGIMNIMLVSVTERTREIGLRMAVGARATNILRQFLTEAVALCLLGGIIGIVFGKGISYGVRQILGWATATSLPAIIAAVAVSATVGILFGFYPAWKASRLDPIEALRYE